MNTEKKNKHMEPDDRIAIQECLHKGMTFKAIGKCVGKDPTAASKEVKLRALDPASGITKSADTCPKRLKVPFVCSGCR